MLNHQSSQFVLLDDYQSNHTNPTSRLYTNWHCTLVVHSLKELINLSNRINGELNAGKFAVVLTDYEYGMTNEMYSQSFQQNLKSSDEKIVGLDNKFCQKPTNYLGLRILFFSDCEFLANDEVVNWLSDKASKYATIHDNQAKPVAGYAQLKSNITYEEFEQALQQIKSALESGDAYQINYTFCLHFSAFGSPYALYQRLRDRQQARFGALVGNLNGNNSHPWILSFSPELFLKHVNGNLLAKPMKGTAVRSHCPKEDKFEALKLKQDIKNRAENVMIVDLLRNDLGRLAITGSVKTKKLFDVEALPTLWQMTSSIEAELANNKSFADIMLALFPCGSITGAPKLSAMKIIQLLEKSHREIYTGAIGWLDKPTGKRTCGNFCLSVAIRTITLTPQNLNASNVLKEKVGVNLNQSIHEQKSVQMMDGKLGIGAGIVLDSQIQSEWQECLSKAQFLTAMDPGFSLIETMRASQRGVKLEAAHFNRLQRSAKYFNFKFDPEEWIQGLKKNCEILKQEQIIRLRVSLAFNGVFDWQSSSFIQPKLPVKIILPSLEDERIDSADPLLAFKTSRRAVYNRAWQFAEFNDAFDKLILNESGNIVEGGRSNVFIKINNIWITPPLSSGVLPGIMRDQMLFNSKWNVIEKNITMSEIQHAEQIFVTNALYGILQAVFYKPSLNCCR